MAPIADSVNKLTVAVGITSQNAGQATKHDEDHLPIPLLANETNIKIVQGRIMQVESIIKRLDNASINRTIILLYLCANVTYFVITMTKKQNIP